MKKITWDDVEQAYAEVGAELYAVGDQSVLWFLEGDTDSPEHDTMRAYGYTPEHLLNEVIKTYESFDDAWYYDYSWGLSLEEGRQDYPGEAEAARKLLGVWSDTAKRLLERN